MKSLNPNLYCFGSAQFGQNGLETDSAVPQLVHIRNIESITTGEWQSAAITSEGQLYLWGLMDPVDQEIIQLHQTSPTPSPVLQNIASVSFSDTIFLAVTRTGEVMSLSPEKPDFSSITSPVKSVIGRNTLSIILCEKEFFTLRDGVIERHTLPDERTPETAVICTFGYAVLATDGTLFTFTGAAEPLVETDVARVAATDETLIVLKTSSRIFEVFSNGTRSQVSGISGNPVHVFAGSAHAGCVTFEGGCWTWGCGYRGQLGQGSYTISYAPKPVAAKEGMCFFDGCAGAEHTLLLAVKDTLFAPTMPRRMHGNSYMKTVRMSAAIPGAFVASELDSKF